MNAAKGNISLAESKIVHGRFHVMKLATEAVDKVRRGEHRKLSSEGDDRLSRTRYLWLTGQENLSDQQRERFESVYTQQLEIGKAWAYKEMLRDLWHHDDAVSATSFFKDCYCTLGITNAVSEGTNSKIISIKRRVGGYRNRENFKTAIYFYCGGLNLYPQ